MGKIALSKTNLEAIFVLKLEWKYKSDSGYGASSYYDRIEVTTRRLRGYSLVNGEECLTKDIVLSHLDKAVITEEVDDVCD